MKTKSISIPKDIFEKNFLFQKGGTKEREKVHKSLTGEYAFGIDSENNVNSELEDGEFLQDSNGIKEVEGKKRRWRENGFGRRYTHSFRLFKSRG